MSYLLHNGGIRLISALTLRMSTASFFVCAAVKFALPASFSSRRRICRSFFSTGFRVMFAIVPSWRDLRLAAKAVLQWEAPRGLSVGVYRSLSKTVKLRRPRRPPPKLLGAGSIRSLLPVAGDIQSDLLEKSLKPGLSTEKRKLWMHPQIDEAAVPFVISFF